MKVNQKIPKPFQGGIPVFITPLNQNHYQSALILNYDEEGLWFRTLFGILPGQEVTIGMAASCKHCDGSEVEALLRVRIIWCKWIKTEKGAYFVSRANYDNRYVEGYHVLTC